MAKTKQETIDMALEIAKATAKISSLTVAIILAPAAAGPLFKFLEDLNDEYDYYKSDQKWQYRSRVRRTIARLQQKGLVVRQSRGEEIILKLTQAGKSWLNIKQTLGQPVPRQKKWDGRWRVLFFDIPDDKKDTRRTIRNWIKRLGFARLQQSVWVIPWPCQEQFDLLTSEYRLGSQAMLIDTSRIALESKMRRIFKL